MLVCRSRDLRPLPQEIAGAIICVGSWLVTSQIASGVSCSLCAPLSYCTFHTTRLRYSDCSPILYNVLTSFWHFYFLDWRRNEIRFNRPQYNSPSYHADRILRSTESLNNEFWEEFAKLFSFTYFHLLTTSNINYKLRGNQGTVRFFGEWFPLAGVHSTWYSQTKPQIFETSACKVKRKVVPELN
jgi:hypothetical protein